MGQLYDPEQEDVKMWSGCGQYRCLAHIEAEIKTAEDGAITVEYQHCNHTMNACEASLDDALEKLGNQYESWSCLKGCFCCCLIILVFLFFVLPAFMVPDFEDYYEDYPTTADVYKSASSSYYSSSAYAYSAPFAEEYSSYSASTYIPSSYKSTYTPSTYVEPVYIPPVYIPPVYIPATVYKAYTPTYKPVYTPYTSSSSTTTTTSSSAS